MSLGGVDQGPQPHRMRGACMGRGHNPSRNWIALQNVLLLRVSAMWMGSAVSQMDDARDAQLSMRALCCCARFNGLLPLWGSLMDRRRLAAVAREVSLWACGRTVRMQTSSTTSPRGSVSPT